MKFLGALAQHTYWFLIMRADLNVKRGDISAVKGKRIGAAPLIDIGLIELLKESGIDPKRDNVQIAPPPMPAIRPACRSASTRRKAMEEGKIDGFWANGMGAEVAVQRGIGTLVLDARRGDGPPSLRGYTFGVLATRADLVEKEPEKAAAAVRALVKTQKALKADPKRATKVGEKWFPAFEASLIAKLVERDLPYYDPAISKGAFDSMCKFAQTVGLTKGVGKYEDVVATQFAQFVEELMRHRLRAKSRYALFDHLVGAGKDRRRHSDAERFRGLEVEDKLRTCSAHAPVEQPAFHP